MKRGTFFAFVGPSLVVMLLFIAAPLIGVAVQSFINSAPVYQTKVEEDCTPSFPAPVCANRETSTPVIGASGAPVTRTEFVGWRNYAALLVPATMRQPFYQALGFTLLFTFATLPLVIVIGVVLAVCLNAAIAAIRGPVIFVSLLPFIVTPVIGALSVRWLFENDGILSDALHAILDHPVSPLTHTWSLQLLMILYRVWNTAPFAFIVFYAALQTLNADQVAAAVVDGASRAQVFRFVVLPHLMPLILFVAIIHVMDAYRVFDEVVGFSSQARVISLQWLTFDLLTPDQSGTRAIGRASASSILTMIGIVVLLSPFVLRFWRDHRRA